MMYTPFHTLAAGSTRILPGQGLPFTPVSEQLVWEFRNFGKIRYALSLFVSRNSSESLVNLAQ